MKNILAIVAVATMSATAFAGGNIDLRGDYESITSSKSGVAATSGFVATRARFGLSGKVSDSLSARMQYDFLSTTGTPLVYAEMINKMDSMTITAGKIDDGGTGGYESLRSTADMYFKSAAYEKPYAAGANLDFAVGEGNLKINLANSDFSGAANAYGSGYGIEYKGNASSFGYLLSYTLSPDAVPTASATNSYLAVGAQYKADALTFSADYLMNTYPAMSGSTKLNDPTKDGSKNSIVVMADYAMGNWIPQAKIESSTLTNMAAAATGYNNTTDSAVAAGDSTISQFSIGTDYRPNPSDANFRYELMYDSKTVGSGTAATTFYAGMRMNADFLK